MIPCKALDGRGSDVVCVKATTRKDAIIRDKRADPQQNLSGHLSGRADRRIQTAPALFSVFLASDLVRSVWNPKRAEKL